MTAAPRTLERILEQQRCWAEQRRVDLATSDHTRDWRANLLCALAPAAERALAGHPARPLGEAGKRAELACLTSRWAILCNHFLPWDVGTISTLAEACGADPESAELEWASRVDAPLGSADQDPMWVDAAIRGDARPTVVLATFCEPYDQPETRPQERNHVRAQELPGCAMLAADLRSNPSRFQNACVGRILDHAGALSARYGVRGFRLLYLWLDTGDDASHRHASELDRVRMRIGGEVDFAALSWRALRHHLATLESDPARLAALSELDARYGG